MILKNIIAFVCFVVLTSAALAARPDQVLVLYNADYTVDLDGSEPGQDSREVAEYYVKRRTCPETGLKPYMLGLTCVHGKDHLNQFRLPEDSNDNYWGLEYIGNEEPPKWPALDSRAVDILLKGDELEKIDRNSIVIAVGKSHERDHARVIYRNGAPVGVRQFNQSDAEGGLRFQFNAHEISRGVVRVWLEAKDADGNLVQNINQMYHDANDFRLSTTGPDGIRDDKNYLEDIEGPVKAFLEDPANALPDGTLLKDHILYIVVCHGLPKVVESMYGIARGPGGNLHDYGDGSSLQQRLMAMYFDITDMNYVYMPGQDALRRHVVPPGQPRVGFFKHTRQINRRRDGVQPYLIVNMLNNGLVGQFNPYQHPRTFRPTGNHNVRSQSQYEDPDHRLDPLYKEGQEKHPRFTSELRRTWPRQSFLYWVMRIDGSHPEIAKAQVDSAIYASRYFTPQMGIAYNRLAGPTPIQPAVRLGIDELKELGFTLQPRIDNPPGVIDRPLIFSSAFSDGPRYYEDGGIVGTGGPLPGAIINSIKSGNVWKRNDDQFGTYFHKMIEAGATVTGGLGGVGGGHITSASWWDDGVLFHHLFRGYTLGESMLMSTFYIDWVAAFIGDPLYQPNVLANKPDTTPPVVADAGPQVEVLTAKDSYCAVISVPLKQTPDNPEMAEIVAEYRIEGGAPRTARNWQFSARPRVILRELRPGEKYIVTVTLIDPYGNSTRFDLTIDIPADEPSVVREDQQPEPGAKAMPIAIARYWRPENPPTIVADAGEITIEFTARRSKFDILRLDGFTWNSERFQVGGGTALTHDGLTFEAGERYKIVARWRRYPLTREVYLVRPDGLEFIAAANNLVPWRDVPVHGTTRFGDHDGGIDIHSLRIINNANPAPDEHRRVYVRRFDMEGFTR